MSTSTAHHLPANITPEQALHLTRTLPTLLLLDLPASTILHIDLLQTQITANFKGVKMVPTQPLHYLSYTLPQHQQLVLNQSLWLNTEAVRGQYTPAMYAYKYSPQHETLEELLPGTDEYNNHYASVQRMQYDSGLAPYPYHTYQQWCALASSIDQKLLARLQVQTNANQVSSSRYQLSDKQQATGQQDATQPNQTDARPTSSTVAATSTCDLAASATTQPSSHAAPATTTIRFAPIPTRTPTFDKTPVLQQLLKQHYNKDYKQLLGELQLAFIELLIGYNLNGLEQWRHIIELLCSSDQAIELRPQLYVDFLTTLTAQLQHLPTDYFTDPLSSGSLDKRSNMNFLQHYLKALDSILRHTANVRTELLAAMHNLKAMLRKRFGLTMEVEVVGDDDEDEEQPTVVELSEEQLKLVEAAERGSEQ